MVKLNKLFESAYNAQLIGDNINAEKLYKKIIKLDLNIKAKSTIFYNIGLVSMMLNKYTDAIKYFDKSNNIKYSDENNWCKCLCLLNLGEWENGMSLFHYRYGETRNSNTKVQFPNLPIEQLKNINDAKGKKVIGFNEQGLGG